jgi:hypothetical protein
MDDAGALIGFILRGRETLHHSDLILRRAHPLGAPASKDGRESEPAAILRDEIQPARADWISPQDESGVC